jgi:hypothetical protein
MGPRTATPADAPDHTPNARPCSSPENEAVTSASDPGTMSAPEIPCNTRSTISHSRLGANPLSSELAPNAASPSVNIRRRPWTSVSQPARMRKALSPRRYPL